MDDLETRVLKTLNSKNVKAQIDKISTGKGFGVTEEIAKEYANRMKEILRNEVRTSALISETTGEYFLDHIKTRVRLQNGNWIIDVYFDENAVSRDTFSNTYAFAYLPSLINNQWSASPVGRAYGVDRHGNYVVASDKYMRGSFKGFIFRAADRFKREVNKKVEIEISPEYTR